MVNIQAQAHKRFDKIIKKCNKLIIEAIDLNKPFEYLKDWKLKKLFKRCGVEQSGSSLRS